MPVTNTRTQGSMSRAEWRRAARGGDKTPAPSRRSAARERVRVRPGALAGVELLDRGHLVVGELEAEDVEVLRDALRRHRLGDHDAAELDVPADDDLAGGAVVRLGDAGDHRVVEDRALRERAPRLGDDPELGVDAPQLRLLEARMQLDLVARRRHAGLVDDPAQVVWLAVRHADRAREPLRLHLDERLPRLDVAVRRR